MSSTLNATHSVTTSEQIRATKSLTQIVTSAGNVHKYHPKPIDTSYLDLSDEFSSPDSDVVTLALLLARDSHRLWCASKKAKGFKYGRKHDFERKTIPTLVAFRDLSHQEIGKNLASALSNLKVDACTPWRVCVTLPVSAFSFSVLVMFVYVSCVFCIACKTQQCLLEGYPALRLPTD